MSIIVERDTEREWWAQLPVHRYVNTGRLFLVSTAACASDERGAVATKCGVHCSRGCDAHTQVL